MIIEPNLTTISFLLLSNSFKVVHKYHHYLWLMELFKIEKVSVTKDTEKCSTALDHVDTLWLRLMRVFSVIDGLWVWWELKVVHGSKSPDRPHFYN